MDRGRAVHDAMKNALWSFCRCDTFSYCTEAYFFIHIFMSEKLDDFELYVI